MTKRILIDAVFKNETRVVKLSSENRDSNKEPKIECFEYETNDKTLIKGNIYLAKISRIEPSLQAAFIEYGDDKSGFLPFAEIHPDYFNIPINDKQKILESVEEENAEDEAANVTTANIYDNYQIQEVIKKDQVILVQALKEERGNKGAAFSTYISLAGRYCVLTPHRNRKNAISKKITDPAERNRLFDLLNDIANKLTNSSIILRTAANDVNYEDLKNDYDYLVGLWQKICSTVLQSKAPAFIHQEESILFKTIRDLYDSKTKEILVQGKEACAQLNKLVETLLATNKKIVKEYTGRSPIFSKFNIENKLLELYQPVVLLPSGGSIVIHPTEAMCSVDINSGRSTSARAIEDNALATNIEAAKELAHQVKLRDIAGLIVVDFIDMESSQNRKIVEKTLRDAFGGDKARVQFGSISSFGLLEMSRQRIKSSFLEVNTQICTHCNGKGVMRLDNANAILVLRTIENEICKGQYTQINLYAHADAVNYLLNHKRDDINHLEQKHNLKLYIFVDGKATSDSFYLEKIKAAPKTDEDEAKAQPLLGSSIITRAIVADEQDEVQVGKEKQQKNRNRRNRSRNNKNKDSKNSASSADNDTAQEANADNNATAQAVETKAAQEAVKTNEEAQESKADIKKRGINEQKVQQTIDINEASAQEAEQKSPRSRTVIKKRKTTRRPKKVMASETV